MPMKTWGDFEIFFDRRIGLGGMGAVYMGRQVSVDRPAAIKVLKKELTANPEFVQRFNREAALLARLVDSHVVQIFGAGEAEGHHYYAMEFVEGEDIASRLKGGYKYTIEDALRVALHVGKALQAAWRHKIVHRDIKPSNVLIAKDGMMKVMDFGLAKNPEMELTQSAVIMGTAKYMSPEQATGSPVDIRSDLYSLGIVLYELSTGQPPFTGESPTAVMYQHVHQTPRPPRELNPDIPEDVEVLILKLMAKNPKERFQDPEKMLQFVKDIVQGVSPDERSTLYKETVVIKPSTRRSQVSRAGTEPLAERPPSSAALYVSLAAALLIVGTGGYFIVKALSEDATPVTPPTVVKPPTGKTPDDPPPRDPATPKPWEGPLRRGLDAFRGGEWGTAFRELTDARAKGAKEEGLEEKITLAQARDLIGQGDAEADEEKALALYRRAEGVKRGIEGLEAKINRVSYRRWEKIAKKHEFDELWPDAAADWERAAAAADDAQRPAAKARRVFCGTFALAVRARAARKWADVRRHFRELAKNPGIHRNRIDAEIKNAEVELGKMNAAESAKRTAEFKTLVGKARDALRRAAWTEARAHLEAAADPKNFPRQPKAEVERMKADVGQALAAPAGMAYVYAGPFRMGGSDRDVEGPEHEAKTGAFYIEVREATAEEYAAFLKAIAAEGHHPGCHPDEPGGKNHEPSRWRTQKPAVPVTGVDWWDAFSYAAWRGKRLPTEEEWEKAAGFHPDGKRRYPWGAEFREEGGKSFFGCDDMGAGVSEWTSGWFRPYPRSPAKHPNFGEKMKVLRGGVLLAEDAPRDARVTFRRWYLPSYRSPFTGIRCARDADQ